MDYRREIDGLRALAVVPVILFHVGYTTFKGGFVGVDVFFVISGYLITAILLSELQAGSFSLVNFYERRARRILPALFLVMFACLPFAWLWLLPKDLKSFSESLIAVIIFVSNILFWQTSGYFESAAELKPLLHTWSLAVEEQFYLFFPLLLMLIWKLGQRWMLGILVFVFVVSLMAAQWGSAAAPMAAFYLLPTRGWELLIGAFIAVYFLRNKNAEISRLNNEVGGFLGLTLLLYAIFYFDNQTPYPSFYTLIPTIGTALIILCANQQTLVGKLLGNSLFVQIGLISYSAYLWHQPLIAFAKQRFFDNLADESALIIICSTLVLSYFSWRYVEVPFRNKKRFKRSQIFKYAYVGSMFFMAVGFTGRLYNGFEGRIVNNNFYDGDVGHLQFHKYVANKFFKCTPNFIAAEALSWGGFLCCMQSKQDSAVDLVLLGDSHAEHLFIGLAEQLSEKNIAFYIKRSYPLLGNPEFDKIFEHVLQTKSIQSVILTMHWVGRIKNLPKGSTLEAELLKTVRALVAAGKTVYLLDHIREFSFPPERCKFITPGFDKNICETSKEQFLKGEESYVQVLKNVSEQVWGVNFFEIRDIFCTEHKCSMVKNGLLMYRDNSHLNIPGSQYVGAEIARKIQQPAGQD